MKSPFQPHALLAASLAFASFAFGENPAPKSTPPAHLSRQLLAPEPHLTLARSPEMHPTLPPLPQGVEDLTFSDFFRQPVGPRGLEITDKLKSLDGHRVRIFGFMVEEIISACVDCNAPANPLRRAPAWVSCVVPGRMLLVPRPEIIDQTHYALCDDLPAATLFVTVPDKVGEPIPYTPGPMLLTGVLSIGTHAEPDGRISVVRLVLDGPTASGRIGQSTPEKTPAALAVSAEGKSPR